MPENTDLPFNENGKVNDTDKLLGFLNSDITGLSDEELLTRRTSSAEIESADFTSELISRYMRIIIIKANKSRNIKQDKKNRPDTEDLISEGFLGLLSAIKAYDSEKGSFSAFANICIENRIKSALTVFKTIPLTEEGFDLTQLKDTSPGADELLIEKENENELSVQLKNILSELEFNVLNLYINSYSYSQISEKLGINLKSVDNTLTRARAKLKKIL